MSLWISWTVLQTSTRLTQDCVVRHRLGRWLRSSLRGCLVCFRISWLVAGLQWLVSSVTTQLSTQLLFLTRLVCPCPPGSGRVPKREKKKARVLEAKAENWPTLTSATFYWLNQITGLADSRHGEIDSTLLLNRKNCKVTLQRIQIQEEKHWSHFCN